MNENKTSLFIEWGIGILGYILLFGFSGFVIKFLFNNFISIPFGIHKINVATAIGIDILVSYLVMDSTRTNKKSFREQLIFGYVTALIVLILGWIVLWFL
ncbi:hypothetical protein [Enterococcus sp. AZ102]|uniref:hypothetical protein n=1 Tax=Enterococcus sp. AZ102 TaxID=2774865 RepID=UPI003F28FDDD